MCITFDTPAGFVDESATPNNPSFSIGTSPPIIGGQSGNGAQFSGGVASDDYAFLTDVTEWQYPAVTAVTVEMWINPFFSPPPGGRAGLFDADGQFSVFLYANKDDNTSGTPDVIRCDAPARAWSTTSVPAGLWTHIACVFSTVANMSKGRTEVYINGVLEDAQETTPNNPFHPNVSFLFIGANAPDGADPFNGLIDGLRAFSAARTQAEICAATGMASCP